MRNRHSWRTKTGDGERRDVTAQRFGGRWTLRSRVRGDEAWTEHEDPPLADLIELRRILFNKYQRNHAAWEHVAEIEALIRDRGGTWE